MDRPCHRIRDFLADQIAGPLPDSEREQVELHLKGCDDCRRYWDQLRRQDQTLSDWASALEPQLRSGLDRTLTAVRREGGKRASVVFSRSRGFPFWRAVAAGLLLAIGFCAGIFSTQWRFRGILQTQADFLGSTIREELTAEILTQVRNEREQDRDFIRQQLGNEFSQQLKETADSLTQTLNRDREWLTTALTVLDGKRSEEREMLYRDLAKLAKMTETEFIRTRRYVEQSRNPNENHRSSDRMSEDPIQGRPL